MPRYLPGQGGPGRIVLGDGPKAYLVTLRLPNGEPEPHEREPYLFIEAHSEGIIGAIAMVQEISVGEVVACLKLWGAHEAT